MRWLQSQPLFKIFSSAKLAVPVLLLIAAVTAYGTLVESRYNSDYAKLIVYDSWWFRGLLLILGLTILLSTLSRWPWKKRHLGFLITHLGLITLLLGSFVTMRWGIDGSLQVAEGDSGDQVVLKERVFEFSSSRDFKKVLVPSSAQSKGQSDLRRISAQLNGQFKLLSYLPFIKLPTNEVAAPKEGAFVEFRLKSQFFDQTEWLSTDGKSEIQMGPARIRLRGSDNTQSKGSPRKKSSGDQIKILDLNGKVLAEKTLAEARAGFRVGEASVRVKSVYRSASVSSNKIVEDKSGPSNPAVELEIQVKGKAIRDVLFAKYPDFSLQKDESSGLRGVYEFAGSSDGNSAEENLSSGNVVDFILPERKGSSVRLRLSKNGKVVLAENLDAGNEIQTPWMGMRITLVRFRLDGEIDTNSAGNQESEMVEIEPVPKQDFLPPSAVQVAFVNEPEKPFWLIEGQVKELQVEGEPFQVYYGPNTIRLPFRLELKKFYKIDYPGTETAMSFASDVAVNGGGETIKISMNEPLKRDGYTLYQSSYELRPGQPAVSIFSVNKDPGRWIKYLGSIILAAGIIIFTIMRSRLARNGNLK